MSSVEELREQWSNTAEAMENVANTFRPDKSPNETANALYLLAVELKALASNIREHFK